MPSAAPSTAPVTTSDKILSNLPSAGHQPKSTHTLLQEAEQQWLFTQNDLAHSPSIKNGMTIDEERQQRSKGLSFITQVGIMLKLPQITLYTACLFFNRFLMRYGLVEMRKNGKRTSQGRSLHAYQIGALALHTSTKVSETPRKIKDIITACVRVALHDPNLIVPGDSKDYWRWRDTLLHHEDLFLEKLCFDLTVESPHRLMFDLLKSLGAEHNKLLRNTAWTFINDSGQTSLGLRFPARIIAGAAVYAAAKHCEHIDEGEGVRFKDDHKTGKPWWSAHHLELKDIRHCCNALADLYDSDPRKRGTTPPSSGLDGGQSSSSMPQGFDGVDDGLYSRLRTPSSGPEELAPTRLPRQRDVSTKRSRDGTPKVQPPDKGPASHADTSRDTAAVKDADVASGQADDEENDRAHKKSKTDPAIPKDEGQPNGAKPGTSAHASEGSEEGEVEE